MTYLLDVNVLIAAIWTTHSQHRKTDAWLRGKQLALCPISELGFLRISSHPRGLAAPMVDAERLLGDFWKNLIPEFVQDDFSAAGINARTSDELTDLYLAELAQRHNMKLATLDRGIKHRASEIIT
jgi:predicted nucleic acid-binding protein